MPPTPFDQFLARADLQQGGYRVVGQGLVVPVGPQSWPPPIIFHPSLLNHLDRAEFRSLTASTTDSAGNIVIQRGDLVPLGNEGTDTVFNTLADARRAAAKSVQ